MILFSHDKAKQKKDLFLYFMDVFAEQILYHTMNKI
jgi:hypothetical protein